MPTALRFKPAAPQQIRTGRCTGRAADPVDAAPLGRSCGNARISIRQTDRSFYSDKIVDDQGDERILRESFQYHRDCGDDMRAVAGSSKGYARVSIGHSRALLGNRAALIRFAATLAIALAVAALAGWAFDVPALRSLVPHAVEMKANTALLQILSGAALLILAEPVSPRLRDLARAFGACVALIAALTLSQYLFRWNAGIDELLFRDDGHAFNLIRGRMSPYSACAYLALGAALWALAVPHLRRVVALAALVAGGLGALSLLGYLWRVREIVTDRWVPPEALPTAAGSLLLALALLLARGAATSDGKERIELVSAEIKILGGYALAIGLMLFGGGYTYRTSVEFADSVAMISHSQSVRAALADLSGSLTEAELAQRNYLLAPRDAGLAEYSAALAALARHTADLGRLTADNRAQTARLAALRPLLEARVARFEEGLAAYRRGGLAAVQQVVALDSGRRQAEDIRRIVGAMNEEEARLLIERERTAASFRHTTLLSLVATLALATGLFMLLFQVIRAEIVAREAAARALRDSEQQNRGIVESSPDCLISLTPDAKIVRMTAQGRRLMEMPEEEDPAGGDWLCWWEGADREAARDALDSARAGSPGHFRGFCAGRRGTAKWWDVIVMPIAAADGRMQSLLAAAREITGAKRAEEDIGRLNEQLQRKARELETTNQELESFSYSVSHDLRAPLRAIDGFAQMIEEDSGGRLDEEGLRQLSVIRRNSRRMGDLIDDLLTFSRMGRQALNLTEINMEALVREVLDEALREHALIPHIEIGPMPDARGDRPLLRQVWVNLVSNALKYGARSRAPRIDIRGLRGAGEIVYSIRDQGVGFNPEYIGKLFGVFERLHRADEFSGTGVGLAIVHRVVTRHGGRVWAESQVGAGAEFFFALPDAAAHA